MKFEALKKEIRTSFLERKKEKLVSVLVDFIENKAPQLIADPKDLRVLTFEHDHTPFEFTYVGYPDPNIIGQEFWLDQFVISAGEDKDEEMLLAILHKHHIVEEEDGFEWVHEDSGEEVELDEIYQELKYTFFTECWRIAKAKTASNYRCFLMCHDVYRGIDADTGLDAESEDIISILQKEGFDFKIIQPPPANEVIDEGVIISKSEVNNLPSTNEEGFWSRLKRLWK